MHGTLYWLIEETPDGSHEIWLGVELIGGRRVNYTVNADLVHQRKKELETMYPEYRYRIRAERY